MAHVSTAAAVSNCVGKCQITAYAGDGFCDDGNNNCGCNWDKGKGQLLSELLYCDIYNF